MNDVGGPGLAGRVALVTGASRGIGRGIARSLAARGATVALVARSEERLNEVKNEIEAAGGTAIKLAMDVGNSETVKSGISTIASELGGLDILVNNAGMTRDGLVMRMSDEDWDRVLSVDLGAAFYFCRSAARVLGKSPAGRIINISSVVGLMGNAGQVNYASAKAGLFGLTRSLAKELGGRGITVNCVAPGFIETDMTSGLPAEVRENALRAIPVQRFGKPEDIAEVVAFLSSDAAGYVTGAVLPVDGGMSLGSLG